MKVLNITLLTIIAIGLIFSFAYAGGNAEKGKSLFNDPKAFSGTSGKSCAACHPDGKGLEKAGVKDEQSLKNTINTCITSANNGNPIDAGSEEMKDLISYIKTLGNSTEAMAPAPAPESEKATKKKATKKTAK